jgi:hypothetical protein
MRVVDEGRIVATLDEAVARLVWPRFEVIGFEPSFVYHVMRLVAARAGHEWGVAIESIQGVSEEESYVHRYGYGSVVGCEERWDGLGLFVDGALDPDRPVGNRVVGPAGPLEVTTELFDRFGLAAGYVSPDGWGYSDGRVFTYMIRAYLAVHPDVVWADPADLVLISGDFEHVVDPEDGYADPRWRRLPSQSTTYRTLARALATNDAAAFAPGPSNLDWRLHVPAAVAQWGS